MTKILTYEQALAGLLADDSPEKRRELARELRVDQDTTIRRWFGKTRPPKPIGENKIRLKVYFADRGKPVEEFAKMKPVLQDAARIFAYGLASIEQIATGFGYMSVTASHQMLTALQGSVEPVPQRIQQGSRFVEQYRDQLPTMVRKDRPHRPEERIVQEVRDVCSHGTKREMIEIGARLVLALVPITDYLASDKCSAEDRNLFRELADGDGVFNVSTDLNKLTEHLNQLCSETIRKERRKEHTVKGR